MLSLSSSIQKWSDLKLKLTQTVRRTALACSKNGRSHVLVYRLLRGLVLTISGIVNSSNDNGIIIIGNFECHSHG